MIFGAAGAAVIAVLLIEAIRRLGRIEAGAAMGVVFTTMFAGGVLLLEMSDTSSVHLDVEHALMGNLESLIWFDALGWESLFDPVALAALPPELFRIALVCLVIGCLIVVFWRPLAISTFDEGFAASTGIRVNEISIGLVIAAALAAVAAFDAVGSIPLADQPARRASCLERSFCGSVGGARVCLGGVWSALAGLRKRCQRSRDDCDRLRDHSWRRGSEGVQNSGVRSSTIYLN